MADDDHAETRPSQPIHSLRQLPGFVLQLVRDLRESERLDRIDPGGLPQPRKALTEVTQADAVSGQRLESILDRLGVGFRKALGEQSLHRFVESTAQLGGRLGVAGEALLKLCLDQSGDHPAGQPLPRTRFPEASHGLNLRAVTTQETGGQSSKVQARLGFLDCRSRRIRQLLPDLPSQLGIFPDCPGPIVGHQSILRTAADAQLTSLAGVGVERQKKQAAAALRLLLGLAEKRVAEDRAQPGGNFDRRSKTGIVMRPLVLGNRHFLDDGPICLFEQFRSQNPRALLSGQGRDLRCQRAMRPFHGGSDLAVAAGRVGCGIEVLLKSDQRSADGGVGAHRPAAPAAGALVRFEYRHRRQGRPARASKCRRIGGNRADRDERIRKVLADPASLRLHDLTPEA